MTKAILFLSLCRALLVEQKKTTRSRQELIESIGEQEWEDATREQKIKIVQRFEPDYDPAEEDDVEEDFNAFLEFLEDEDWANEVVLYNAEPLSECGQVFQKKIVELLIDSDLKFQAEVSKEKTVPLEQAVKGDNPIAKSLRENLSNILGIEIDDESGHLLRRILFTTLIVDGNGNLPSIEFITLCNEVNKVLLPFEFKKEEQLIFDIAALYVEETAEETKA